MSCSFRILRAATVASTTFFCGFDGSPWPFVVKAAAQKSQIQILDASPSEMAVKETRLTAEASISALTILAERNKLPTIPLKVTGGAFAAWNAYDTYDEGRGQGQDKTHARGRAFIGWGVAEIGMGAAAEICVGTAGLGCPLALGIGGTALLVGGVLASYDYILARQAARDEQRKLDRADSSVLGDPCVDYNVKGDLGVCADGSFAPPPQLDIEPFGRGSPPAWINLR
ncbi:MAG: hypothetical protein NVV83_22085 [Afipia sp.]|nr:hypothetical protein [Afipia sp.]